MTRRNTIRHPLALLVFGITMMLFGQLAMDLILIIKVF